MPKSRHKPGKARGSLLEGAARAGPSQKRARLRPVHPEPASSTPQNLTCTALAGCAASHCKALLSLPHLWCPHFCAGEAEKWMPPRSLQTRAQARLHSPLSLESCGRSWLCLSRCCCCCCAVSWGHWSWLKGARTELPWPLQPWLVLWCDLGSDCPPCCCCWLLTEPCVGPLLLLACLHTIRRSSSLILYITLSYNIPE